MKWSAKILKYKGEMRIGVWFEKDDALITWIKSYYGARWSQTNGYWHIPDTEENRKQLGLRTLTELSPNADGLRSLENFKKWLRSRRYSESTITVYIDAAKSFLVFFNQKRTAEITNDDVILYNNEYILKNKLSASYQNQVVSAIKLFFSTVHDRKIEIESIHRPKRAKVLPNVLSKEEVKLILEAHGNLKHRAMLCLIYSCGLRRKELLTLKLSDIDSKRNIVKIIQAKGKKDRIAPLSPKVLALLRDYYKCYKPKIWLFEGQVTGEQYSEQSLQSIFKQALQKAGIGKPATLHWLRHSYATHWAGTEL